MAINIRTRLFSEDASDGSDFGGDGLSAKEIENSSAMLQALRNRRKNQEPQEEDSDGSEDQEDDSEDNPKTNTFDDFDLEDIFSGSVDLDQNDDDGDEGEETKEDDGEEGEEESEEAAEEDEDEVELETEDGKPISKKAKEAFATLKKKNKDLLTQLTEARDAAKGLKPVSDFEGLEKENKELRKQLDLLDFRSSEDFKNQYSKPVQDAIKEATRWIGTIDAEYTKEASSELTRAQAALTAGDESAFFKAVDNINDEYLQGSRGARFAQAMNRLWDASEAKRTAEADMEKAREEISSTRQSRIQSSEKIIEATLGAAVKSYQDEDRAAMEFYRNPSVADKFKVDEVLGGATEKANKMLNEFLATGKVGPELSNIIISGSLKPVRDKERELLLGSISNFQLQLKKAQDELAIHQEKLKKISSKKGSVSDYHDNNDDEDEDSSEYGLVAGLRKMKHR